MCTEVSVSVLTLFTELELFLGGPYFNSLATFLNSQLVCLLQVGILTILFLFALFVSSFVSIGPEEPHWGSGKLRYSLSIN